MESFKFLGLENLNFCNAAERTQLKRTVSAHWHRWVCFASNSLGTDYGSVELVEESAQYLALLLAANILAAASLCGVVLVCRRIR